MHWPAGVPAEGPSTWASATCPLRAKVTDTRGFPPDVAPLAHPRAASPARRMTSIAALRSKSPATWISAGAGGGAGGGGNFATDGALGSAGVGLERVAVACCGADPVGDLLF